MNLSLTTILVAGVLFVVGYLLVLRQCLNRWTMQNSQLVPVAMILLMIYTCAFCGLAVLVAYAQDLGILLLCASLVLAAVELLVLALLLEKHGREIRLPQAGLFLGYLAAVLLYTVLSRDGREQRVLETDLFAFVRALQQGSAAELYHVLLNILLFVPLGYFFVQMLPQWLGKPLHAAGIGLLVSLIIETCQLVLLLGNCDVADLVANTLGSLLGLVIYHISHPEAFHSPGQSWNDMR